MPISNQWGVVLARHSGKIIHIAGGSHDAGAVLQQWQQLADHPNQRFMLEDAGDGYYRIRVKHSGRVLDVAGGSRGNGAHVVQYDSTGGQNQLWRHAVPID